MGVDKMAGNGKESGSSVFFVADIDADVSTSGQAVYSGGIKTTKDTNILKHLGRGDDIANFSF